MGEGRGGTGRGRPRSPPGAADCERCSRAADAPWKIRLAPLSFPETANPTHPPNQRTHPHPRPRPGRGGCSTRAGGRARGAGLGGAPGGGGGGARSANSAPLDFRERGGFSSPKFSRLLWCAFVLRWNTTVKKRSRETETKTCRLLPGGFCWVLKLGIFAGHPCKCHFNTFTPLLVRLSCV